MTLPSEPMASAHLCLSVRPPQSFLREHYRVAMSVTENICNAALLLQLHQVIVKHPMNDNQYPLGYLHNKHFPGDASGHALRHIPWLRVS